MIQGLAAAAALLAAALPARAAEMPIRFLPEPGFDQVVVRAIADIQPRDAFAGLEECEVVDARTYAPVPAAQAQAMLEPCLKGVARRYGQTVRVERVSAAPESAMSTQVEGLAIYVPDTIAVTAPLMRDLNHALSRRQGRILGHAVVIRRVGPPSENKPVTEPSALTRSALQRTVDSCVTTQVVRRIETAEDFISSYGRCIVSDSALQVRDIRPSAGRPMAVTLQSLAEERVVRSLNGQVKVQGSEGPVTIAVVAYTEAVFER